MYNIVTTQCSLHPDMSYVTGIKILLPNVLFVCFLGRGEENGAYYSVTQMLSMQCSNAQLRDSNPSQSLVPSSQILLVFT